MAIIKLRVEIQTTEMRAGILAAMLFIGSPIGLTATDKTRTCPLVLNTNKYYIAIKCIST